MKNLILFLFLSIVLSHCSISRTHNDKHRINIRHFKEQHISTINHYRHVQILFEKEITGNPDEITQTLQAIEKDNGSYYRVYYQPANKIRKYEHIQGGRLTGFATFDYGSRSSNLREKVVKIRYFDENMEEAAIDEIKYNNFGRPIKTTRYIMPGRQISPLF